MAEKKKSGKKGRKYGRKKKAPCQQRYTAAKVWEENKRRRAQQTANKFGKPVKIKIGGEWVTVTAKK